MRRGITIMLMAQLIFVSAAEFLSAQEQVILIDTTEYMPLPEGLNFNLSVASSLGYTFEIHRMIRLGADLDYPDDSGATPLIYAVANGNIKSTEALLSYDPEMDFLTNQGESPLHLAAKYGFIDIGEALIRKGADINILDQYACTPLHYSSIYGDIYFTDMLLYYNAQLDIKSKDGTTPLIASIWTGNAEISDLLIQSGANCDIADYKGFTPLHVAAQNGDTLIAELILVNGGDIKAVNKYGYDALDISIRADQLEMSDYLLKKMAVIPRKEKDVVDPFDVASSYGRKDIIELMNSYDLKQSNRFVFDQVSFSAYSKLCFHDIYLGSGLIFTDPLHNVKISAGIDFKPGYTRVLVREGEHSFSQYRDKRYVLYFGTGKNFLLSENYLKGDIALEINVNLGYMFSNKYPGTYISPGNKPVVMPSILIRWSKKPVNLFFGYEYMVTGLYKAGPNWVKLGISVNMYFNNNRAPLKDVLWY